MTLDETFKAAKAGDLTNDTTYKVGEISRKTGLQKQPDGSWAPPKNREIANVGKFEEKQKEAKKAKSEAELKEQRAEGEANAAAFQKKVENGEIVYNKESGQFEEVKKNTAASKSGEGITARLQQQREAERYEAARRDADMRNTGSGTEKAKASEAAESDLGRAHNEKLHLEESLKNRSKPAMAESLDSRGFEYSGTKRENGKTTETYKKNYGDITLVVEIWQSGDKTGSSSKLINNEQPEKEPAASSETQNSAAAFKGQSINNFKEYAKANGLRMYTAAPGSNGPDSTVERYTDSRNLHTVFVNYDDKTGQITSVEENFRKLTLPETKGHSLKGVDKLMAEAGYEAAGWDEENRESKWKDENDKIIKVHFDRFGYADKVTKDAAYTAESVNAPRENLERKLTGDCKIRIRK